MIKDRRRLLEKTNSKKKKKKTRIFVSTVLLYFEYGSKFQAVMRIIITSLVFELCVYTRFVRNRYHNKIIIMVFFFIQLYNASIQLLMSIYIYTGFDNVLMEFWSVCFFFFLYAWRKHATYDVAAYTT